MTMSMQEIFDKSVGHLRIQGVPAIVNEGRQCVYRTEEGLSCAVGCLIPQHLYHKRLENLKASDFIITDVLEQAGVLNQGDGEAIYSDKVNLLESLQEAHDVYLRESLATFEEYVKKLAEDLGLTYTAPV